MQSLLTVTSYADSYDLTTLETAKLELGISPSDATQDDRIVLLIHQVSSAISTLCDRVFAQEEVREVFRLNSGSVGRYRSWVRGEESLEGLILRRRPISSITTLTEDEVIVDSSEYECNLETGILYRLTTSDFRTTWLANKISVDYVAGWVLLGGLPFDIEKACLLWLKSLYANMLRRDLNVKVEDVPDLMRREYFDRGGITSGKSVIYDPPSEVMILISPYIEAAIR